MFKNGYISRWQEQRKEKKQEKKFNNYLRRKLGGKMEILKNKKIGYPVVFVREDKKEKGRFTGKRGEGIVKNKEIKIGIGKGKEDDWRAAGGVLYSLMSQNEITEAWAKPKYENAFIEGLLLKEKDLGLYKSEKKKKEKIKVGVFGREKLINEGMVLAEAQNYTREILERPPNLFYPKKMVEEAKKLARKMGLGIKVYDEKQLKKMGMGGIIAVGKGSINKPYLVILEYKGAKKPKIGIVGKGVIFDSGGISIKPSKGMYEMKYDKAGACAVMGIMYALAKLRIPVHAYGVMPLVENIPSAEAQRPSDIIRIYNKKTVEVLNTDAEGRLILADALSYISEKNMDYIIDMATLTGAIIISLGTKAIGLFSNDDGLSKAIIEAGEETGEKCWRMPLWEEYGEMLKSDIADLKNIGSERGEAGSITAAKFLENFVNGKWAHLDIAGWMHSDGRHPYLSRGAIGAGVRLVIKSIQKLL